MSGLREEQREAEVLVTLIVASLPSEPRWCHREQAHSHTGSLSLHLSHEQHKSPVGVSLLAIRSEQTPQP